MIDLYIFENFFFQGAPNITIKHIIVAGIYSQKKPLAFAKRKDCNMGAEKPSPSKQPETAKLFRKRQLKAQAFFFCLMLLLCIGILNLKEFMIVNEDLVLSPRDQQKLQKRLKEIDDGEQYALIASEDGWYACLHRGCKSFYLKAGEVWKYGVTSIGQFGRYSGKFFLTHKVSYVTQYKGTVSECLKQEQIKLYYYRYLPENLARQIPDRLTRPPYNPIMR